MHVGEKHAAMFRVCVLPGASKKRQAIIRHDVFKELGVFLRAGRKGWDEKGFC